METKQWNARKTAFKGQEDITWALKDVQDNTMCFCQWPFGMYVIETYLPAAGVLATCLLARYIGSALVTAAPSLIDEDKSMGSICASSSSRSLQAVAEPQQQQQQQVVVSFPSSQAIQSACKVPAVGSSWWQPPEALGATIHSQCSSPCQLLGQAQHLRSCHDRHSADVPS